MEAAYPPAKSRPLAERKLDVKTLMTWEGWNFSQARLLLKMHFDLALVQAALARKLDNTQSGDLRRTAGEHARTPGFMGKYGIGETEWARIGSEPVRAYAPVFIRRRLTLPHDPGYYGDGILPSLRSLASPGAEARRLGAFTWGKRLVETMEKRLAARARAQERIGRFIKDGERQSRRSLMRELGLGARTFAALYDEVKGNPKRMPAASKLAYLEGEGRYVRVPLPGEERRFVYASRSVREAYAAAFGVPYLDAGRGEAPGPGIAAAEEAWKWEPGAGERPVRSLLSC